MDEDEQDTAAVDVPLDEQDEPLAGVDPVQLIETAEDPSAAAPTEHGEWVDADPGDPDLDHGDGADQAAEDGGAA